MKEMILKVGPRGPPIEERKLSKTGHKKNNIFLFSLCNKNRLSVMNE